MEILRKIHLKPDQIFDFLLVFFLNPVLAKNARIGCETVEMVFLIILVVKF